MVAVRCLLSCPTLHRCAPIFVPRLLSERPQLAALVAETISTWSYAEHGLGRSAAAMSRGINLAEMEAYSASGLRDRLKIVRRIARTELHDPYLTLFLKVLGIISSLGHRRHAFAHGIWGTVEAFPADLLVEPSTYSATGAQRTIGLRHLMRVELVPLVRLTHSTTGISKFRPRWT